MRRILLLPAVLLAALFAAGLAYPATAQQEGGEPGEVPRTATRELDATDPTAESNPEGTDPATGGCFPGCRGAEQLILYTPAFGERTGTNPYGYEVTVVDGRVTARGGNDNPIPEDGYVLSGHGGEGAWLTQNAPLGARVEIEGSTVRATVDAETYLLAAERSVERAQTGLEEARDCCMDVPYASAERALGEARGLLVQAREAQGGGDERRAARLAGEAGGRADLAWYRTRESRPVEGRGVWVRPTEESPAEISATLDRIERSGANTVFLETFYQGYTIYPSQVAPRYGIPAQRPQFRGFDPLEVWVREAEARGIEVHAWVHTFFVGSDETGGPGPVLEAHPDWAAVEREDVGMEGPQPSSREPGYYFVDPANPEARRYVLELFEEMTTRYDLGGLHLDYIRYPVSLPLESSYSYSDYSRRAFEEEYGSDPYRLTPESPGWEDWVRWRQENVTSFVGEARAMLDREASGQVLSAAVFPDGFDSKVRKLQDWERWAELGYMDVLAGMSFGRGPAENVADTEAMLAAVDGRALVYTGIYAPFFGLPPDAFVDQVEAVRGAGAHGEAAFAYNQATDGQLEALGEGPFRKRAVAPHGDPTGAVLVGARDLRGRLEEHYVPGRCVDRATARPFRSRLNGAIRALERAERGRGDVRAAIRAADRELSRLERLLDSREGRGIRPELAERLGGEVAYYREVLGYARDRS